MRNAHPARVVCCLLILAQPLFGDDATKSTVHARVSAIIDVVLDHHIDPPTRQEMILSGVRSLYQLNWQTNPQSKNRTQPRGLSRRVSELFTPDDIEKFLDEVMMEFDAVRGAQVVLIHGMLECVRGGASLRSAESSRVSDQVATNRYVGTGIALGGNGSKENAFVIRKVIYNGPAWKAGAKDGDVIAGIDEKLTDNMQLNQVLEALRGEAGSKVTMLVRQPNETETRKLVVTRGRVFFPSIEGYRLVSEGVWKYSIDADPKVALIRLKTIGPSTLHELRQVEVALRNEGVRGVVVDLRNSPEITSGFQVPWGMAV